MDLPLTCKPIDCKRTFRKKMKNDDIIDKFMFRLVAQGFRNKLGINHFNTYLEIHQMNVKTAFLYGELDEEVYMKQPKGFVLDGQEHTVCKLVKQNNVQR